MRGSISIEPCDVCGERRPLLEKDSGEKLCANCREGENS